MWRPKDWEKTLRKILDRFNVTYMNSEECKLIEAGADAMLEKLRATGYVLGESIRTTKARGWLGIDPKSKWYCIPDEE